MTLRKLIHTSLSVVFLVLILFMLAACRGETSEQTPTPSPVEPTPTPVEPTPTPVEPTPTEEILSPSILVSNQTFLLQSSNHIIFTVDYKNSINHQVVGHQIASSDYQITSNTLVIFATYLNTLLPGDYQFSLVSSGEAVSFNIKVEAIGLEPIRLFDTILVHTLHRLENITIEFDFKGAIFTQLKKSEIVLSNVDYLVIDENLTINSSYLNGLSLGTHEFTLYTTYGEVSFEIIINDLPTTTSKEMIKFPKESFSNESLLPHVTNTIGQLTYYFNVPDLTTKGTLSLNPNEGTFSFNPKSGWFGTFTFEFYIIDSYNEVSNISTVTVIYKEVKPIILAGNLSFDRGNPLDLQFSVNRKGIEPNAPDLLFVSIIFNDETLDSSFVIFNHQNNQVTIKKDFLSTLGLGQHIFRVITEGGSENFTVEVVDSRIPYVSPNIKTYILLSGEELTFALETFNAPTLVITRNDLALSYGVDYEINHGTLIIFDTYLESLSIGNHILVLITEYGIGLMTVSVVENENPPSYLGEEIVILSTEKNQSKNIVFEYLGPITLRIRTKGVGEYQTVSPNNYETLLNVLTLKDAFLITLNPGIYELFVEGNYGNVVIELIINDSPTTTSKEMIKLPNEAFNNETLTPFIVNIIGDLIYYFDTTGVSNYGQLTTDDSGLFSFVPNKGWYGSFEFTFYVVDIYGEVSNLSTVTVIYKEVKPYLAQSNFYFDINGSNDLIVSYNSKGNPEEAFSYPFVKLMIGDVELQKNVSFTMIGESIILFAGNHLNHLEYGSYEYTLFTEGGTNTFTIHIMDSRQIQSSPSVLDYLTYEPSDLIVTLTFYDKVFETLSTNGLTLEIGTDYQLINQTLTIKNEYLSLLNPGTYVFKINNIQTFTVLVKAATDIVVDENQKIIILDKDSITLDLNVSASLKTLEDTLVLSGHGITSNDYLIFSNTVTLKQSYLISLAFGIYRFTIINPIGSDDFFDVVITSKPQEISHPDGQTITKFTNELITNEPLRVFANVGYIISVTIIEQSEITSFVGTLSINQTLNQFTFSRASGWWGIVTFTYQVVDSYGFESDPITMTIEYKPLNLSIFDKDDKEYYKASLDAPEASIVYTLTNMQGLPFYQVLGYGITPADYVYNSGLLTIKSSYLMTLDYGKYTFEVYTTGGKETILITVLDALPPALEVADLVIKRQVDSNISVEIELHGHDLLSIKHEGIALVDNVDYQILSDNQIIIFYSWWATLNYGKETITFENAYGTSTLILHIRDDKNPTVFFKTSSYVLFSEDHVEIVLNLYGNHLTGVTGHGITSSDYTIINNTIFIHNAYLDGLEEGDYHFTIGSDYDTFFGFVDVNITINFVPKEAVVISDETVYNHDHPSVVTYTILLNDYSFLDVIGLGISEDDYSFNAGILTISLNYLKYFFEPNMYELILRTKRDDDVVEINLLFEVIRVNHAHRVINEGFETGDLFGWNPYQLWKDEHGLSAFRNERVVSTNFYGSSNTEPYNRDGSYHFGVYAHPYVNANKDLNQERMGMLRSSDFILGGSGWISFKLGGGQNSATAYVSVRLSNTDFEIARFGNRHFGNTTLSGTSNAEAYLFQYYFNLSDYLGESLYFLIVDAASAEWSVLSFDSFYTYYEVAPSVNTNTLANDIKPIIYQSNSPTNSIFNNLSSNVNFWEDQQGIFQWQDGRARTNNNCGDGCIGAVRSPAFIISTTGNTHLKWEWEGDIRNDKQLFLLIKEVGTNTEVLRLVRRADQSGKTGGGMVTHWYDLSSLDSNKAYYIELVDNHKGSWGLMSIRNIELVASTDPVLLDYRAAINANYGLALVNIINGRHRFIKSDFSYEPTTEIYYVMSSVGENPNQEIHINYHSYKKGSSLIYTTAQDPSFSEAITIYPTCKLVVLDGFVATYQCSIHLTGLNPNTTYIYKIQDRVNTTKTYQFKTPNESEILHIILFSDTQFENLNQASIYNQLLNVIFEVEENIALAILTGDIVEYGGKQNEWDMFFEFRGYHSDLLISAVPGNHDYYKTDNILTSSQYFNTFFSNPLNGDNPYKNASYFFILKDTLFIMLDTVGENQHHHPNNTYGASQIDWFKSVINNHPTTFIVVGMHYSPYGDYHRTTNQNILNVWGEVFDEMQVDLVITGHDHAYTRTYAMFDQTIASHPQNGTVYLSLGAAGHKLRSIGTDRLGNYAFYQTTPESIMSMMTIDASSISITAYNLLGNVIDTFSINPKPKS